jgi:hypothetical protein
VAPTVPLLVAGVTAGLAAAGLVACTGSPLALTGRGPATTAAAELAVATVPAARVTTPGGTATLGLLAAFPADAVPLPPGALVTASAVGAAGDRLEVSVSGTTTATAAAVVAFYDTAFAARGYTRRDGGTLAPGTAGRVYAKGDDVLVLAVTTSGAVRSFSVGGTVTR